MQATSKARRGTRALARTALALAAAVGVASAAAAQEVNVYSYRQPQLINPLLKAFTDKTGIKTNVIYAGGGLNERLKAEGRNSPADVLLTVDVGRLTAAKSAGITQPVESDALNKAIPAHLRDSANHWFGLTMRARIVYVSRERVKQDSITYEELADPKWKGKICIRSGQHVYNTAVFASMIAHHGAAYVEKWLKGVRDNLARKPAGGDRTQAEGIFAGECDIALGNTYYLGKMATNEKNPEQKEWAAAVRPIFPNAQGRGTHVNVSGVAMAKHAPHKDTALKLMEFLASEEAQKLYAALNYEYPVTPGVAPSKIVQSWGELKIDPLPLTDIAKNLKRASELVDKVNFDAGPST